MLFDPLMADSNVQPAQTLITALEVQEFEWSRVSRILHDQVGQVLSAIGLQLDLLRMDFKENAPEIVLRTQEIQRLLEHAVIEVRDLSYEMDTAMLERTGLPAALDRMIGRFRKSFHGELRAFLEPVQLPRVAVIALYRIATQAVENAIQHAKCSRIGVRLKPMRDTTVLEVRDEGTGFSMEEARRSGRGLPLMAYYASQAGVELSISSKIGKGTTIRATFPAPRHTKVTGRVQLKQ